jgi:hypothetical protein
MAQMVIPRENITYRMCSKPGERVAPPVPIVADSYVEIRYADDIVIRAKLEALDFEVKWVRVSSFLPRLEHSGYEVVIENDCDGMPTRFVVQSRPETLVLAKRPTGDFECPKRELLRMSA